MRGGSRRADSRRVIPFIRVGDRLVPSLSVAAVLAARARSVTPSSGAMGRSLRIGTTELPLLEKRRARHTAVGATRACRALIHFRGPALRDNIAQFHSVLVLRPLRGAACTSTAAQQRPRRGRVTRRSLRFQGRIVIVGRNASGTFDVFPVPFPGSSRVRIFTPTRLTRSSKPRDGPASAAAGDRRHAHRRAGRRGCRRGL